MNQGVQSAIASIQRASRDVAGQTWNLRNAVSKMSAPAASDLTRALSNFTTGALGVLTAWRIDQRDRSRASGGQVFADQLMRAREILLPLMREGGALLDDPPANTTREQIAELGTVLESAATIERRGAITLDWWNRSDEALLLRSDPFVSAMFGRRTEQTMARLSTAAGHGSGAGSISTGREPPEEGPPPPNYMWIVGAGVGIVGGIGIIWLLRKVGV